MPTSLHLEQTTDSSGKLAGVPKIEAISGAPLTLNRLAILYKNSGTKFLVDTGADVSVIPKKTLVRRATPSETKLYAANGTPIITYGDRALTLNLSLCRAWRFVIANVQQAIIGANFLKNFNLLVDLRGRRLLDGPTKLGVTGSLSVCHTPSLSTVVHDNSYKQILQEFITVTRPTNIQQNVQHYIITKEHPVAERAHRLSPIREKAARTE